MKTLRLSSWLAALALLVALTATAHPLFAANAPQKVRIPALRPRPKPPEATFSHWGHNKFQCFNCHPSVFRMSRYGFTHQEMKAGQHCGACHDGKASRAIESMKCEACHVE